MFVSRLNTSDVDLFPLNGHIVGFEDGLDRFRHFSTNAVSYQDIQYVKFAALRLEP